MATNSASNDMKIDHVKGKIVLSINFNSHANKK